MRRRGRQPIRIRSRHTPLRMTSMMDILTVLLLFLLKSFVVEGEVITPVPGVELPESSSETTPQSAVVIAIFDDNIMVDSELVASVSDVVAQPDLVIDALAVRLDEVRRRSEEIAVRRGEDPADFEGQKIRTFTSTIPVETFKAFDGKDATLIQKREQTHFVDQVADFLTACRTVNKTDSATLLSQFGSLAKLAQAGPDDLALVTGMGQVKVKPSSLREKSVGRNVSARLPQAIILATSWVRPPES